MHADAARLPILLAIAVANFAIGFGLATGATGRATALAILPVLVVGAGALIASNRSILVFGAFALDLSGVLAFREPVIGSSIYASDVIVVLAVGSWIAGWLIAPGGRRPSWLSTPVLGLPLCVFMIFIGLGVVRGHERWGLSYFSQPLRFVVYALIAAAIADMKPQDAWRGLVAVFYAGAVWNAAAAVYYLVTGTVQQEASSGLSTGGIRVLTLTTALYLTGAVVLALLNLEREQRASRRVAHLVVAGLATFGIVVSYGRGVLYAIAAVLIALFLTRVRLRRAALALLPLCLPALVLGAIVLTRKAPDFTPQFLERMTTVGSSDPSIHWREAANRAIWQQVRDDPVKGVGFGKEANFSVDTTRFHITQDPHNSYLFLWAGGGILALGSFMVLLLVFLWDSWRRWRFQDELPRALIVWSVAVWFCFALDAVTAPQLTQPNSILVFWILMLLPAIVPYMRRERGVIRA